jgi:3-methyladenine DNA glycosylase AlkD
MYVMTAHEVLAELQSLGTEQTKKTWMRHGAKEPVFGVKIGDMKPIQKRIKKDYQLALDLYDSENADAMYFAGLIADETKMTKKDLQKWAAAAQWNMHSQYTVPWIAAESRFGWELGNQWIDSKKEHVAVAGWGTLASLVGIKPDEELDIPALGKLLDRVAKEIHTAPNRVRYSMNCFLIALGGYVKALTEKAIQTAKKIGKVEVDLGDTDCKVPDAAAYINMMKQKGAIGKKRKMARC